MAFPLPLVTQRTTARALAGLRHVPTTFHTSSHLIQRRSLFSFFRRSKREQNEPPEPVPLLTEDNLVHPFSKSPFPQVRARGEAICSMAPCPICAASHTHTHAHTKAQPKTVKFECPDCGWPTHCSEEHWKEDKEHEKYCSRLREANEDEHDLRSGRRMPEFELPGPQGYEETISFANWDVFWYTRGFNSMDTERSRRHASKLLTYPMTIGSVLHQYSPLMLNNQRLTPEGSRSMAAIRSTLHTEPGAPETQEASTGKPQVRIFVLGARGESSLPPHVWEQLGFLFPAAYFHIFFIGPQTSLPRRFQPGAQSHTASSDPKSSEPAPKPEAGKPKGAAADQTSSVSEKAPEDDQSKSSSTEVTEKKPLYTPNVYDPPTPAPVPSLKWTRSSLNRYGVPSYTTPYSYQMSLSGLQSNYVDVHHLWEETLDPYSDVFFFFSPGFGFPSSKSFDPETGERLLQISSPTEWGPVLPMLLASKCPIFVTGFSPADVERDVKSLSTAPGVAGEFEWVVTPGPNPFGSEKWEVADFDPRVMVKTNWGIWAIRVIKHFNTRRIPSDLLRPFMSLTSLLEAHSSQHSSFQTPTKRKRFRSIQEPGEPRVQPDTPQPSPKGSSNADIWKWVFSAEAIALCFVRDIFDMRHHEVKDEEYYWIGNIPCRTVRIVGMIVGVQRYENKVVYTVDDGTSVIDCIHKCKPPAAPTLKKGKKTIVDPLARAIAYTGALIRVTGRVQEFYESRQIIVDTIEKCSSPNEEPLHWKAVMSLHESKYSSTAPFVVLESAAPLSTNAISPLKPATPSIGRSPSNPILPSSDAPSPTKSIASSQHHSPGKLRHPSRLHSHDLTANTFRIYLKHYMNNPPPYSDPDADTSDQDYGEARTPTKRLRTPFNEATSSRHNGDPEETPRPSHPFPSKPQLNSYNKAMDAMHPPLRGFTLSYLRRVPQLSELALRVCRAETKRRDREARKKAKQSGSTQSRDRRSRTQANQPQPSTSKSASTSASSSSNSGSTIPDKDRDKENSTRARMKRLFGWAILQLLREGSIVLWDPKKLTYPCSMLEDDSAHHASIWRNSSSASANSTMRSEMSLFSAASANSSTSTLRTNIEGDDEDMELSEPESNEDAYISLFPEYLADEVERAIRAMTASTASRGQSGSSRKTSKEGILGYLQRDDKWKWVGEWSIDEALEYLKDDGRAVVDRGIWKLLS
ncbi:hypothetical protein D9758_001655 [Tetrapyrgos nigripes]|uniref:Uncharacterized protein n=1 Tax=Tetrapyrgos nigripes TaxID=182062 RepID=A0A8H5GXN8_9AGAR|nr:hypothetical protein D9758_001655 [Tetrapyrgos nigripes]